MCSGYHRPASPAPPQRMASSETGRFVRNFRFPFQCRPYFSFIMFLDGRHVFPHKRGPDTLHPQPTKWNGRKSQHISTTTASVASLKSLRIFTARNQNLSKVSRGVTKSREAGRLCPQRKLGPTGSTFSNLWQPNLQSSRKVSPPTHPESPRLHQLTRNCSSEQL